MTRWRIDDDGRRLVLSARGAPLRWDAAAVSIWPAPGVPTSVRVRLRLAHQIRQDVWRAARRARGFVPLVAVRQDAGTIEAVAGGTILVAGALPPGLAAALSSIVADEKNRRRWLAHAGR